MSRVKCCRNLLKMYEGNDHRHLFEIMTGDETWVKYSSPLFKQENKVWKEKHLEPPMIPRPDFRSPKIRYCVFFDAHGLIPQVIVPKGQTVKGTSTPTDV